MRLSVILSEVSENCDLSREPYGRFGAQRVRESGQVLAVKMTRAVQNGGGDGK